MIVFDDFLLMLFTLLPLMLALRMALSIVPPLGAYHDTISLECPIATPLSSGFPVVPEYVITPEELLVQSYVL